MWWSFLAGMSVGTCAGFVVFALMSASREADDQAELNFRKWQHDRSNVWDQIDKDDENE